MNLWLIFFFTFSFPLCSVSHLLSPSSAPPLLPPLLLILLPHFSFSVPFSFSNFSQSVVDNAHDFILWGVDDVLYFDFYNLFDSVKFLHENKDVVSVSLRLAPQVTYCHPADAHTKVPTSTWWLVFFSRGIFCEVFYKVNFIFLRSDSC